MNRKEPQPLKMLQDGKSGTIQKNGRTVVVKKPAQPSPPPPPKAKSK
jgi:hypothetical protein